MKEVVDILDIWSFLEAAFEKLPPADKEKVAKDGVVYGDTVEFAGFDSNNGDHYSVAPFLVPDLGRFQQFAGVS